MQRITVFICLLIAVLTLSSCSSNPGMTKNAMVELGDSQKFTKEEVQAAAECILEKFKDFNGCDLKKLWYDEERSKMQVEVYMSHGKGSVNGIEEDNVIVLYSDFYVYKTGGSGGFNPDSDYENWNWILIRNTKIGNWRADDWGY